MAQTYTDLKIILVDDGSPDSCPVICDEYAHIDSRITVIHKPNGGLSVARNAGLDVAQGEYVIFLDSDDWWDDNDALRKIDANIRESGADIVIIGMKKYSSQEECTGTRASFHCQPVCVAHHQRYAFEQSGTETFGG